MFAWFGREQRKDEAANEQEYLDRAAYADSMRKAGWHRYEYILPPSDETVQMHRYEWSESTFCTRSSLHPTMNVAGLWWRPVQHDIEISRAQIARR